MKNARAKPANSRDDPYLRRLGEQVRTLRNQRGMTRKALAAHAKVSERYLAQLRALMPEGQPFPRSRFTRKEITEALSKLPITGSTARRYHASWSSFAKYLVENEVIEVPGLGLDRLMESLALDARRISLHRHRPAAQVRKHDRRDGFVVRRQLTLGDPIVWKEHLLRVCDHDCSRTTSRGFL